MDALNHLPLYLELGLLLKQKKVYGESEETSTFFHVACEVLTQNRRHRLLSALGSLAALWPRLSPDPTEMPHAAVHCGRLTHPTETRVTCRPRSLISLPAKKPLTVVCRRSELTSFKFIRAHLHQFKRRAAALIS